MCPGKDLIDVKFSGAILEREVDFCFKAISKVKANESSWNYLNGYVLMKLLKMLWLSSK